jgi:hypothetical protein
MSSLEIIAPQIAVQMSSSNRHLNTTVQRRLRKSGLHGRIVAKKPLLKDTNKKKLAWAKKHEQWTLDHWESKFEMFFNCRFFVRRRVGEQMVPTVMHGGVMLLCWGHRQ